MSEAKQQQPPAGRPDITKMSHFILDTVPRIEEKTNEIVTFRTIGNHRVAEITEQVIISHKTPYYINANCELKYQNIGFERLSAYTREEIHAEAQRLYNELLAADERRKQHNYACERVTSPSDASSSADDEIKMGVQKPTCRSPSVPYRRCRYMTSHRSSSSSVNEPFKRKIRKEFLFSRKPMPCPQCQQMISSSYLLNHFLSHHMYITPVRFVELYENHRFIELLTPLTMRFRENQLLALYAYGGRKGCPQLSLIARRLAIPNIFMYGNFSMFRFHIPMLMFACRTSWSATTGDSEFDTAMIRNRTKQDDLWVIWLTAPHLVKPLYVTLTAYDSLMTMSKSRILRVRDMMSSQNCCDFMSKDFNYLYLRYCDVKEFTNDFRERLGFEVIVDEILDKPAPLRPLD